MRLRQRTAPWRSRLANTTRTTARERFRVVGLRAATARERFRDRPGLSLIEVLLSMAIFFIAIVAISRLVDMGADQELESRLHTTASRLAQAKLAEVEAGVESLEATGGDFGEAEPGWAWEMTAESEVTNLYRVTVVVSREFKGRTFSYTLAQMMLDPAVKGAAAEAARPDPSGGTAP